MSDEKEVLLMKISIGKKISGGFLIMLLLIGILGGYSYINLKDTKELIKDVELSNRRLVLEAEIESEFKSGVAAIRAFIAYGDEKYYQQVETAMNNTLKLEDELLKIAKPERKEHVQDLIKVTTSYKDGLLKDLAPIARQHHQALAEGKLEDAKLLKEKTLVIANTLIPITNKLSASIEELLHENEKLILTQLEKSRSETNRVIFTALLMTGIAVVIGGILSFFLTKIIRNPILEMANVANQYAEGDLRDEISEKTKSSSDEIGILANAINKIQDNFLDVLWKIKDSSNAITTLSQHAASAAEQTSQAANQVAETITAVAKGAEKQSSSIDDTVSVIEEMSAAIDQVAASAGELSNVSQKTSELAKNGGKVIDEVSKQMSTIETTSSSVAEVVYRLGESSKEIGQIVTTISSIAEQTNLLALNAAIESARAGEHGRGFAVVAEEVRKLAEQSQEATKKIALLISEIQKDTENAVQSMKSSIQVIKIGTEVSNNAGKTFNTILDSIQQVITQLQEITASTQQMASGSEQIVNAIRNIDSISKEIAGGTQTVSAATQEQAATMEELSATSQNLAHMAEELSREVNRFMLQKR
jgi:methyl-accepting chemotaxis protein